MPLIELIRQMLDTMLAIYKFSFSVRFKGFYNLCFTTTKKGRRLIFCQPVVADDKRKMVLFTNFTVYEQSFLAE